MEAIRQNFTIFLVFLQLIKLVFSVDPVIIVHGGAGTISNVSSDGMLRGISIAVTIGYEILRQTDDALEAVEEAGLKRNSNYQ